MSYILEKECEGCKLKYKCTDRFVLDGAIQGIHYMHFGVGHLGGGVIKLICNNIEIETEEILKRELK